MFRAEQIETLRYRAARYETTLQGNDEKNRLENQLGERLEELLFKLYPEGLSRRSTREYRYGSKGALSISCSGSKAGTFYDNVDLAYQ